MSRQVLGAVVIYTALMAFCTFGVASLPASAEQAFKPYFWLLGPPASSLYGTNFLVPFVAGTVVVAGLLLGTTRSRSPVARGVCGLAFLAAWSAFGFLAYAPGA